MLTLIVIGVDLKIKIDVTLINAYIQGYISTVSLAYFLYFRTKYFYY